MKFDRVQVYNFVGALRGMRNPLESWDRSDSYEIEGKIHIGENDLKLARKLIAGGTEHRKFLRQIVVSVDVTAPLFWWKEFDTYKIGTTANSTSTMHKLASTPITLDCFEIGDYHETLDGKECYQLSPKVNEFIKTLEELRLLYLETKDKNYWKELIRWLPESWLQTRTLTMNYENIYAMYKQRKNHKLKEWSTDFINWVEELPYFKELFTE